MRILAVLLGASILLNITLIARRAAPAEPAPRPARPARPAAVAEAPSTSDPEVLALRTRVRELEAEKPATRVEAVVAPDRLAGFREKLARAMKLWRNPKGLASAAPETQLDLSEVTMEFQRAKLARFKDPRAYVDMLRTVLEQAAVESKKPLSDDQRETLRRTLEEYETALAGLENADGWERFLREVGPEADLLQKLRSAVPPDLEARTMAFGGMTPWGPSVAPWIDRTQAENHVVQHWMSAYGLDEAQKSAVTAAARVYLHSADALNAQMGASALPGRESAEWRRRTAHILVDALGSLEGSLTPEQRERLRQRRPAEIRIYDAFAMQRYAR